MSNTKMSRNLFIAILALVQTVALFTSCSGNGEKEFEEGMKSYKAEQYETAFKLFEKGADCGHAGARTYLGMCYALGRGVERNDAKGVELIREAAEQGYAEAQEKLGLCYQEGVRIEKDYAEAAKWFREAAEQGNPEAHISLGFCYLKGRGVAEDEAEAFRWMKKCTELSDLPPDIAAAAEINLGILYLRGAGVKRDREEAFRHFKKAAKQNPAMVQEMCDLLWPESATPIPQEK